MCYCCFAGCHWWKVFYCLWEKSPVSFKTILPKQIAQFPTSVPYIRQIKMWNFHYMFENHHKWFQRQVVIPLFTSFYAYLFIFLNFIYLFIFGCIGSSLLHGFSLVAASGGCSSLWCTGFSLWWLVFIAEHGALARGLSSCGARA